MNDSLEINPNITSRFVLLSIPRSGTTAIMKTLNDHPDIAAHGEAFLPRSTARSLRPEVIENTKLPDRFENPMGYLSVLMNTTQGPKCVGFKMWEWQSEDVCNRLMADQRIKKILLERENRLASYASLRIAKKSGVSHVRVGSKKDRPEAPTQVHFDPKKFLQYVTRCAKQFEVYQTRIEGPLLKLKYTQLRAELFAEIHAFLGVDPQTTEIPLRKINSSDILSRFVEEDRDLVRTTLDELGHPEWVRE